ncbi:MAG: hypothetical protein R3F19_31390 [Verrucomicrobiales bacterium]
MRLANLASCLAGLFLGSAITGGGAWLINQRQDKELPVQLLYHEAPEKYYTMTNIQEKIAATMEVAESGNVSTVGFGDLEGSRITASVTSAQKIDSITLNVDGIKLVDYGVDGVYDLKFEDRVYGMQHPSQLFFSGEWRSVSVVGGKIVFDFPPHGEVEFVHWSSKLNRIVTDPDVAER